MLYFKHYANASRELPVRQIKEDMGYYGLGVFWTIMERVTQTDGMVTVEELEREFCSKNFSRKKVQSLIADYGVFSIDGYNCVKYVGKIPTVCPDDAPTVTPTVTPTVIPTVIPTVTPTVTPTVPPSNTHACKEKIIEDKNRVENPNNSDNPGKAGNPEQSEQPEQPEVSGNPEQPRTPEPPEPPEQPEMSEAEWAAGFREHYPTLAMMQKPLTRQEYQKLRQRHSQESIRRKLEHMENIPDIQHRYKTVYLTVGNWLRES